MKSLVEKAIKDLSTRENFLFQIGCDCCGREYHSKPRIFSKTGITPTTREKQIIFDAVYEMEHSPSRRIAVQEMAEHFNYCPVCKRLVCNYCFLICEDIDLCKDCAKTLQENGIPVMTELLDVVV